MDDLLDDDTPGRNEPEYTVAELSGAVKRTLEDRFGRIRVRGEVGRVFRAKSGHLYYDLKDDRNVLACTTWKGQLGQLSVLPEEGLEVIATGRLSGFASQSKYTLNVDTLAVAGQGALMAMLEKRRAALAAEGLFEADRKQALPFLPEVIGVITSPQGAVIRDILHRLRDRFPRRVVIWPVAVQGKACAPEVTNAIRGFNALPPDGPIPRPDLLIVARGGGSIEDLWGFNEDSVVRAAADSQIPLISAVGHETDTTLIDHAADRRAPTPTAAAEMAVPVLRDLAHHISSLGERQTRAAKARVAGGQQRLADLSRALPRPAALLESPGMRLGRAAERLPAALLARTAKARARLQRLDVATSPASLHTRLAKVRARLEAASLRLAQAPARRVERLRNALAAQRLTTAPLTRATRRDATRLDQTLQRLSTVARNRQTRLTDQLAALDRLRRSLGPDETLARGFAIIRDGDRILTTANAAAKAKSLEIEFSDGRVTPTTGKPAPKPKPKARPKSDQGSLF